MDIKKDDLLRTATAIYAAQCVGRLNDLPDNCHAVAAAERLIRAVEWRIYDLDQPDYEPCKGS